jgi:hypothetical protein
MHSSFNVGDQVSYPHNEQVDLCSRSAYRSLPINRGQIIQGLCLEN